ncbi:penicillin-binding transpeptidase domain-containing protein [Paenibacillus cremeus]|uniref:PASTA domain-containing protein n=1 Tax=Paenibacillus cremeus TaxID=2163881 RepID=A0A559KBT9_9BACL|nr:penicillin-binding transpeptidase domain-containing protein [Paenibacillus cremeus]TVY09602.1 PASTA domain-containing protein [Paenibacillus cremeus]
MTKKVKLRSLLVGGLFTLLFVFLVTRLYWVQVVQGAELLSMAKERWAADDELRAVRGAILDRNDKVLAEDAPAFTLALNPKTIHDKHIENDVVRGLAAILAPPQNSGAAAGLEDKIRERINKKKDNGDYYTQIELGNEGWKIDADVADQINKLVEDLQKRIDGKNKSVGILLLPESKRFYPGGKLASHILGYTSKEGKPIMGIEAQLDNFLKGTPGFLKTETDRYGVELPNSTANFQKAINGDNVRLTIDKNIQFYIENALDKVNEKWHPKSLTAIAVDPKTMEILGIANTPSFNPNRYWDTKQMSDFQNHAVASQYEPGSTFKLVTLAATVEEGLFNPTETYQSGSIQVPGRKLHDHNVTGWGKITYLEGLKRSSNVAFVKLGYEKLGETKLRQYIDKFGFGAKTNVDIPGEVPGLVNMKYPAEFATATYGQGLTATAIQQTAAYGAIANGGKLMWPHIIKEIYNPETGEVIQKNEPQVVRQVVSEKTAKQVSDYLEGVVSDKDIGTGRKAYIEGYRIAGKTGTANLVDPGEKGYAEGKWVISFIGYAPIEDPRILVTIIADQPDLGGDYHLGGDVAAPAFKEIVSQTLRYMGIAPSTVQQQQQIQATERDTRTTTPDLTGMPLDQVKSTMNKFGVTVEALGKGAKVLAQSPVPGTEIGSSQRIYVLMQEGGSDISVPDLSGKSLRDALEVCSFIKLHCSSTGEGYVTSQTLDGTGDSRVLTLQLKPLNQIQDTTDNDKQDKSDKSDKTDKPDKKVKAESVSVKPQNGTTAKKP